MQKYFSKKVIRHGIKFDSTHEADRYDELIVMQKAGLIEHLELQKGFEIIPKLMKQRIKHLKTKTKIEYVTDEQAAMYHCDFFYLDNRTQTYIIEEFKSVMTAKLQDYVLRRKLIKKKIAEWNNGSADGRKYEFREVIFGKKKKNAKPKGEK